MCKSERHKIPCKRRKIVFKERKKKYLLSSKIDYNTYVKLNERMS